MPSGLFSGATSRKVLKTDTHTVSGSVLLPNGFTDYNRYGIGATGPAWSATAHISLGFDDCSVGFASNGPERNASDVGTLTASIQLGQYTGAPGASLNFAGTYAPGYEAYQVSNGRGNFGDTVSGGWSISVPSQLVAYVFGEPDVEIPDDQYPDYGGVRVLGEFPSSYAILVWEPVPGSVVAGTVTLGDRSASATAPSSMVSFSSRCALTLDLGHSPVNSAGQESYRPAGTIRASVNFSGYPLDGDGAEVTYAYSSGSGTAMRGRIGAGYAEATIDTASEGVSSGTVGGIALVGDLYPSCKATVLLDAVAMDHPHPHACVWKLIKAYRGVEPPAPGETYGTILDPPEPIETTLTGQAVSDEVDQRREGIVATTFNKSVGPKVRSAACKPAQGLVDGIPVTYDHYRNDQGPVECWIVPPPGEHPNDWRVCFVGKAEDALTISHAETRVAGEGDVAEGYRYAEVASDGTALSVAGKSWDLDESGTTLIDLCFPKSAGGGLPDHDSQDTRWPLDAARKSTVNTPYWGVSVLSGISIVGGSLSSLTLKRLASPKLHFLAPFVPPAWEKEVPDDTLTTSDGDEYPVEHWCARLAIGDVDGRQGMEVPHVRRTDNYAPGRLWVSDYTHLTIAQLAGLIGEIDGWTAAVVGDAGGEPSWHLGLGFVRQGGSWVKAFDVGPGTRKLQPRYDSVKWPGDVRSDVFDVGGGSGFTLVGRKVFRGAAYGGTKNDGTVHASDITGPGALDQATTSKRFGLLGPTLSDPNDWGLVWVDPAHKASVGGLPRRIQRVAFGIAQRVRGGVANLHTPGGRYWVAYGTAGGIVVKTALLGGPTPDWRTTTNATDGEGDSNPCLTWDPLTSLGHLVFERDEQIYEATSSSSGEKWDDSTVSSLIPGGRIPRLRHTYPSGHRLFVAVVDDGGGGGAGKLVGRYRWAGDLDYGDPFDLTIHPDSAVAPGEVLRLAGDAAAPSADYDVYPGRTSDGRWSLTIVRDGDDGPSEWFSVDDGRRWKPAGPS